MSEQTIGQAYVQIVPSTRGISKDIQSELGGTFDGAAKRGTSAFSGLFKRVVGFAAVAGTAVAGYFSAKKIFGGGLDRLLNIEDAQAKLRGLGHDAGSVSTIMANSLAAVKGTVFGLDEAATTAAGAVAAGIRPGIELESVLKSVANSAAAAGTSMGEMGGIYNKVASLGVAQNDVLRQVAERGIPIYETLAEQLGVTSEEVFKMASAGKIGFAEFESAMSAASGTVADEMGNTTRGALALMGSSLSRIGAGLLGGVFPLFKETVQGITALLGPVEDGAARVGAAFGSWVTGSALPALQSVGAAVSGMWAGIQPVFAAIGSGLSQAFSGIDSGVFDSLWAAFQGLVAAISPLVPQVIAAVTAFNPLSLIFKALQPILPQIVTLLSELGATLLTALTPVISTIVPIIATLAGLLAGVLTQAIMALLPVVTALLPAVAPLVEVLGTLLVTALQAVAPLIGMLAGLLVSLLPAIAPLALALVSVVQALMPIVGIVAELIGALLPPLVALFMALLGPILSLIAPLVGALAPVLQLVGTIIGQVLVPIIGVLAAILSALLRALLPVITAILGGLVTALTTLIRWVVQAAGGIASFVSGAITGIGRFASSVGQKIGEAIQWFRDLPGRILSAVGSLNTLLYQAGKNVIQGLIDGVSAMVGRVAETIGSVAQTIRDFLPFSPAKVGPLSGRGSPDLAGRKIARMLAEGLSSEEGLLAKGMHDVLAGGLSVHGAAALTVAGAAGRTGPAVVFNGPVSTHTPDELASTITRRARDAATRFALAGPGLAPA